MDKTQIGALEERRDRLEYISKIIPAKYPLFPHVPNSNMHRWKADNFSQFS